MKKILMFVLTAIFLTSCASSIESGDRILPPKNTESPIYGEWYTNKIIPTKKNKIEDGSENFANSKLQLTKDYYILNNLVWDNISLETKVVNAKQYFDSIDINIPSSVKNVDEDIEVFSVIRDGTSIAEIVAFDNSTGVLKTSRYIYEISRVSQSTDVDLKDKKAPSKETTLENNRLKYKEGILLGLKTPGVDEKGNKSFSYRTVWISMDSGNLKPIYQVDSIVFPRRNGFWSLTEEYKQTGNFRENIFVPKEFQNSEESAIKPHKYETQNTSGNLLKEITYICNDFISVNITGSIIENEETNEVNKLQLYPISNLPFEKPLSIKDIFSNSSFSIVNNELSKASESIQNQEYDSEQDKNIGILRRDSHWLFTGRINYLDESRAFSSKDYNISVLPPSNIVFYDNLFLPINEIESNLAINDVFSSPEKNMAVVLSGNSLFIFNINKDEFSSYSLDKEPVGSIKLNENETVIMSEWSSQRYASSWDKFIKSNTDSKQIEE